MFHNANFEGEKAVMTLETLRSQLRQLDTYWIYLKEILKQKTKLTENEIENIYKYDIQYYMNCYEALEKGFIDEVI